MASQITANIIKNGEPVDILYGRLSQEDDHAGDSNSIVNQRSYLEKYAADNGFQNPVFMADDGYSGTNFDRPAWQDIVTLIEAGLVRTLIVKDMSRLGREYLKVGELTELYFPSKGVRFIAVNDGVDSLVESSSDFNPIRNWANELHAKDTSRKVRSVKRMQAENGERLGASRPTATASGAMTASTLFPTRRQRVSSSASSSSVLRGKGRIRSPAYCGTTMC